jgi:DNA-binding NarL/FixJ family response regulator
MIAQSIVSMVENLPRGNLDCGEPEEWRSARSAIGKEAFDPEQTFRLKPMAKGRTQKQIARDLAISPHAMTDYCKSIYQKLEDNSRTEAKLAGNTQLKIIP